MKNLLSSFIFLAFGTVSLLAQPVITNQPLSQTVWAGTNVTFTVGASGAGPFSYQWLFDSNYLNNSFITTVAGNGSGGYGGDGSTATNATIAGPQGVAADGLGNFFIADYGNNRIRKVDTNGIITTLTGGGAGGGTDGLGDGSAATNASLNQPYDVAVNAFGNVLVCDAGNNRIRMVDTNGIITTIAGGGAGGGADGLGDGGAATNASLNFAGHVAVSASGDLFISDVFNQRIRKVDTNGMITTFAGGGTGGGTDGLGDGGAATNATFNYPHGLALDSSGNLFIADWNNNRVRRVDTNGIITVFAGGGAGGGTDGLGDGLAATNATLNGPVGLAFDAVGNLFIGDTRNNLVRKVDTNGIITSVVGGGINGLGDGGAATNASLNTPNGVAVDVLGNLLIADSGHNRIRLVGLGGSPILTLKHVTTNNAGYYQVIVGNYSGSVTSDVAVLTVKAPPVIIAQPTNQMVALGGTIGVGVTATGLSLAYQWFKDGRLLPGANGSTLMIPDADIVNSGTYSVVVSNPGGIAVSLPALVAVGNPTLISWGNNQYGQLGNGTTSSTNRPITVASNTVVGAAGLNHSLFVTTNGVLWAIGNNQYGQLGNGTTSNTNLPTSVASNVVAVAAGGYHSLFVTTNGTLWAMGRNNNGQLGNGKISSGSTANPVSVASNVVSVAAGQYHSLFITSDGTLWAMGYNQYGQLGNGSTSISSSPVSVAYNVVAVAAGANHSLFITSDGTLWAMGNNQYGQLGNGTTSLGSTANPISVASNVVAVAAGASHSLFVTSDGTLWAMGNNQYGQLGNGTTSFGSTATPVSVASNVVELAAGANHSLFVMMDGSLWSMGQNSSGQLGVGTTINTNIPVSVPHQTIANIFPADQATFSLAMGRNQMKAAVTLSNLYQLYTGNAIHVQAGTTPAGLPVDLTYNWSASAPVSVGSYLVIGVINDLNYYGSATNILVVGLPAQNFTSQLSGSRLKFQLTGTPNYLYVLQMTTNLTPPVQWQSIITNPADVSGTWRWTNANLSAYPAGFYRAVTGP